MTWSNKLRGLSNIFERLSVDHHNLYNTCNNKAFIDIRLCPGVATPLTVVAAMYSIHVLASGPLRPNVTPSIKPEVHNVSQRRPRRTEPWPQGICIKNFVKIGPAVPELCQQTKSHTHRQQDAQTDKLIAILCSPTGVE